jgi:hypothetical protein
VSVKIIPTDPTSLDFNTRSCAEPQNILPLQRTDSANVEGNDNISIRVHVQNHRTFYLYKELKTLQMKKVMKSKLVGSVGIIFLHSLQYSGILLAYLAGIE